MRLAIALLFSFSLCSFSTSAQQAPTTGSNVTAPNDKELHEQAVKLVTLMGVRQRMLDGSEKMAQEGKAKMLRDFPSYDPAFSEEWAKRMQARFNVQDYLDVFVRVYEKHFDKAEILEMIEAQNRSNSSQTPNISAKLKEKLTAVAVTVQSEIFGGCVQVGAKVGGDIGQEIGKEHPEWIKVSKQAAK